MREVFLLKLGEIVLKGLNRKIFEDRLVKNIERRLEDLGKLEIHRSQSTITLSPVDEDYDFDEADRRLSRIFGIAAYSRAAVADKDMNSILDTVREYFKDKIGRYSTFKVESKRSDQSFPLKSPQISREVGGFMLKNFPHLKVDVHNPELTAVIEIRDKFAYIRGNQEKGACGLPVGTSGKAAVLLSGGIDSPVAAYMMAKRGVALVGIHFASKPYTSQAAQDKVIELARKVSNYSGDIPVYVVSFTQIQETIRDKCPEDLSTLILRRLMMQAAQRIAQATDSKALITGESVGQVASQTLHALACTDDAVSMPVFRPLIGMDKEEIITIARKIDTFETSVLPYEDCCTVFTPKHPRTRPTVEYVRSEQEKVDFSEMLDEAIRTAQLITVKTGKN